MKNKIFLRLLMSVSIFIIAGCGVIKEDKIPENNKYDDYELVNDLKKIEYASTEVLVKFDGVLYGKSNAIIDYAGGMGKIGIIDKVIPSKYVPKLNSETNTEDLLNAKVYDRTEKSIILYYNNEYVLFEKINR